MPVAYALDRAAAVDRAIAIGRDIRYAQINPKHVVDILGRFARHAPFSAMRALTSFRTSVTGSGFFG